jgi:hypothetical protein
MAGGRPPSFNSFTCPNCQALYELVRVEAGPETTLQDVKCLLVANLFPLATANSFSNTFCYGKRLAYRNGALIENPSQHWKLARAKSVVCVVL